MDLHQLLVNVHVGKVLDSFGQYFILFLLSVLDVLEGVPDGDCSWLLRDHGGLVGDGHHSDELLLGLRQDGQLLFLCMESLGSRLILLLGDLHLVPVNLYLLSVWLVQPCGVQDVPLGAVSGPHALVEVLLLVEDSFALVEHELAIVTKATNGVDDVREVADSTLLLEILNFFGYGLWDICLSGQLVETLRELILAEEYTAILL